MDAIRRAERFFQMVEIYRSEQFRVRKIKKPAGGHAWVLERPQDPPRARALDQFDSPSQAIYTAIHCEDQFEGSYSSEARLSAKWTWNAAKGA